MEKYSTFEGFDYILKRKPRQKSIRMHIDSKGRLSVSCNYLITQKEINNFLGNNKTWIEKHSALLKQYDYVYGEKVLFWGNEYILNIQNGRKKAFLEDSFINLFVYDSENKDSIRRALCRFYQAKLMEYIPERLDYWCQKIGIEKPVFGTNNSKSRWGVCYCKKKEIKISAMTACLPEDLIDMTILHEVCHLVYPNHSNQFWNLVRTNMPDIDERKQLMKHVDRTHAIHSLF